MQIDEYGEIEYTEEEICEALRKNPDLDFENIFLKNGQKYIQAKKETFLAMPNVNLWNNIRETTPEEYHTQLQQIWLMPEEYSQFDIELWLYNQCATDDQRLRVQEELTLYKKFNLLNLLRYLKYLRDTAEKNNIVWGVGRGSSCSSYCLFLLKIHRVDALLYNLDYKEFLKEK
jgi:DNA polymerase III alpha subunit